MKVMGSGQSGKSERGQILIILALVLPILVLFSALAIDVGFAYVTKARLSKAVDAACLSGMRNLSQGQATAQALALNSFNANYPTTGLDASAPVVSISFSTNASGSQFINVNATATIRTFFMQYLPQWKTLTVKESAQALRSTLVMSLVLDRSGSMVGNGGGTALINAGPSFVQNFSSTDYMSMISFASNATVNVAMANNNISNISNTIKGWNLGTFTGGTFGPGGVTLAKIQEEGVNPSGNVVKVMVYFTDGHVNTVQDTFACTSGWGDTLYNYGGYDSGNSCHFFEPSAGTDWGSLVSGNPPHTPTPNCTGITNFYSQQNKQQENFTANNIAPEARYRALQTANDMLNEGIVIYSIGLGTDIDETFLKQLANDRSSPTYDPNLPQGLAVFAPDCPSSTCTQELNQVFQTIAAKILLRLTQ